MYIHVKEIFPQLPEPMAKKIAPKKNAGMLLFEPRLCHDPTIDYIPHMEAFLGNIQSLILILYEYHGYHKAKGIDIPAKTTVGYKIAHNNHHKLWY